MTAGADGMGEARTAEGWLSPDDESFAREFEVWDLVDEAGAIRCAIWSYLTDNTPIFHGTSSVVVGGASQGGLACTEAGLKEAILAAKARMDTKGTLLRFLE